MDRGGDGDTNCNWCTQNIPEWLLKWLEDLEIRGLEETAQNTASLI